VEQLELVPPTHRCAFGTALTAVPLALHSPLCSRHCIHRCALGTTFTAVLSALHSSLCSRHCIHRCALGTAHTAVRYCFQY